MRPLAHKIEYRTVDKADWDQGPWQNEPDKMQWLDEATDLDCLIVRNRAGALCGYVGVPEGHPLFGRGYDTPDVSVHGGLTFADACADSSKQTWEKWRKHAATWERQAKGSPDGDAARDITTMGHLRTNYAAWVEYMEAHAICHRPLAGRSDHVWWFDCAHAFDHTPALHNEKMYKTVFAGLSPGREDVYRDLAYVIGEVQQLADQLKAVA